MGTAFYIGIILSIVVFGVAFISLIIKAIKKKAKKKTIITIIVSVALFIGCSIGASVTDPQLNCEHDFELVSNKDATCTEDGYASYKCRLCEYEKTDNLKSSGHQMTEVSKVNPTDSTDGELIETCSVCGYSETTVLAKMREIQDAKTQDVAPNNTSQETKEDPSVSVQTEDSKMDPDDAYLASSIIEDEYALMNEDQQKEYSDEMDAVLSNLEKYCYDAYVKMISRTTEDFKPFYEWDYPSKFKKDRKKIFELFEEVVDNKIVASTSNSEMIMVKSKIGLKHEFIEYIVRDSSDDDVYIYYGESKKGVPNGIGILFEEYSVKPVFAGNFKDGKVKGYGIIFDSIMGQIRLESEDCSYSGKSEFLASGDSILYATSRNSDSFRNMYNTTYPNAGYENKESAQFSMMSIAPYVLYEGEMKDSKRSGDGKEYYDLYKSISSSSAAAGKLYGQLKYDGEWKYDEYNGKGQLFNEDGSLKYKGKFSNGKIKN